MNGTMTKTLCSLALALSVGVATPVVHALPTSEVETYYFSDATYRTEVGYAFFSCTGGHSLTGRRTRYAASVRSACQGSSSSDVACYVDGVTRTCPGSLCDSGLFECQ